MRMSIISSQTFYLLSLSRLRGVGPAALKKAAAIPSFAARSVEEIASVVPQIARSLETGSSWNEVQEWAQMQVATAEGHNVRILSALDPEYPALLAATKDDPLILYVQGSLARPEQRSVAVIGTREPTHHGAVVAMRITTHFAQAGWSIVSGLAIGCDGLSHQEALKCGAHTVAVLAHGLHMIAPSKHKKLSQDILAGGGALVSEYPFGQGVQGQQYVKRDRTQAGMALGVVMIQSDIRGGSLHASRASLEYGRWLAVPCPTDRDLQNNEPKVQANLVIADASPQKRAELLRCTLPALEQVIVLRRREDYSRLTESNGVEPFKQLSSIACYREDSQIEDSKSLFIASDDFSNSVSSESVTSSSLVVSDAANTKDPQDEVHIQEAGDEAALPSAESGLSENRPDPSNNWSSSETLLSDGPLQSTKSRQEPSDTVPAAMKHSDDSHGVFAENTIVPEVVESTHRVLLCLMPLESEKPSNAFSLWMLPKKGSKEFKTLFGNAKDDEEIREFYARHRRLHDHLVELQRKVLDTKRPRSHDQILAMRLITEEIVLHLSKLVLTSAKIEARSKAVRQRIESADWIEQSNADWQLSHSKADDMSESGRSLIEDLAELLKSDLKPYLNHDEDSTIAENHHGNAKPRLSLHRIVERLNSVLVAAF